MMCHLMWPTNGVVNQHLFNFPATSHDNVGHPTFQTCEMYFLKLCLFCVLVAVCIEQTVIDNKNIIHSSYTSLLNKT